MTEDCQFQFCSAASVSVRALHVVSVLFRGFGGVGGGSVPAQCYKHNSVFNRRKIKVAFKKSSIFSIILVSFATNIYMRAFLLSLFESSNLRNSKEI